MAGGAIWSSAYILMAQMLKQLQLSVGSLGQYWSTEGLHYFLDRHGLAGQLVPC